MQSNKEPPAVIMQSFNTESERKAVQIEERKRFSYEERLEILKSTKGICAHCGKPLKTSNMTVEHIIPIMRGGTNDMENLTALCEECNRMKDNLIYLPESFYMAIMGTGRYNQMEKMVRKWYQESMTEDLDIQMFPLIAPIHQMMIAVSKNTRKIKYNKQFVLQWMLVGKEQVEETEAITGLRIKTLRRLLHRQVEETIDIDTEEFFKDCVTDEDYDKKGIELEKLQRQKRNHNRYIPVTCYTLRKLTSDRIFAIVAVRYDKTKHDAVIYLPWCDMTKKSIPKILYHFIKLLFYAVVGVADNSITDYMLLSPYQNAFDAIKTGYINDSNHLAFSYSEFQFQEKENPENITYGMTVNTYPSSTYKPIQGYIQIPAWVNLIQDAD